MKLFKYTEFIKENRQEILKSDNSYYLPSYDECVDLCNNSEAFYESKTTVDDYNISLFNYRLAGYADFISKPFAKEMRGLCFVFNKDGSVYNRYILLEKFFNINQVPESMYSIVKNYKIKFINNKEDGSIASFIKLPNGKIIGRSKMGFDNDQANAINKIYKTNPDVKKFVDHMLSINYVPIFEYVSNSNRIVLRYTDEELILLRVRNNETGKHIDIRNYLDILGTIKIAPFEDDKSIDELIELVATQIDKEGSVVTAEDENGKDFFFKIKTPWYLERHGLLKNDIYRENIIINYILDDKIDDMLGQIPEDEVEAHERINKIISIVRKSISNKITEIENVYQKFIRSGQSRKDYAIQFRKGNPYFKFVISMIKRDELKRMSREEILSVYDSIDDYEKSLKRCEPYEMAKEWLHEKTKRLNIAREWLKQQDPTLFFQEPDDDDDDDL